MANAASAYGNGINEGTRVPRMIIARYCGGKGLIGSRQWGIKG